MRQAFFFFEIQIAKKALKLQRRNAHHKKRAA